MNKEIKSLTFFPNGVVMAIDQHGEQMPEIQKKGWMELYFERLMNMGFDPKKIPEIHARLNDGTWKLIQPFLTTDGQWYHKIVPIN